MMDHFGRSFDFRTLRLLSKLLVNVILLSSLPFIGNALAQSPLENKVNLTPSEEAWLAEHSKIRLAIDVNWAPFEFVDDQKQYRGMAAEYIRLVGNRLGIEWEIDKERPWPKMVEAVKNRELDAFSLVVRTPQRDEFVNFTRPYISFPMVIVTQENEPYIDGIEPLNTKSVGVVRSYASHDLLAANHPELDLRLAENVRKGLEAVSNGETYAFVGNLAVVGHVIESTGLSNLKISGQTPYRFELSMAVRNDWPELIPILQKALDSITADERRAIHGRWIQVKYQNEVDYTLVILIIVIASVIILVIYGWNKKLRREIEHRQKAEKALKASEQKYRAMFTSSNVGLALCKMDGALLEVNQGFCDILGRTQTDTLQLSYWDITPREYESQEKEQLASLHERGTYGPYEKEYIRADGTRVPVLLNGSLVLGDDGKPLIWSIVQDISGRKKAEELVELALANAEVASKAKSEFLASMSHELRTPMNAVLGYAQMLKLDLNKNLLSTQHDYIASILDGGNHLLSLINQVLDLASIEAGVVELKIEKTSAKKCIAEAIGMIMPMAQKRSIRIEDGFSAQPEVFLLADHIRLHQVLLNLLSNAVKFNKPAGTITLYQGECKSGFLRICIEDTGIGISEKDCLEIFQMFHRINSDPMQPSEGTGIGLAVTKDLVEKMNGEIGFKSELGIGTTFWFDLPLAPST